MQSGNPLTDEPWQQRQSDMEAFSTHTMSLKYKNDCTLHPKTPSFPRQGATHREWGDVTLCTGQSV